MKKILVFVLLLCSAVFAGNPYRVFNNFNAGELSPLLNARDDLAKYQSGCQVMENLIPLPQGGATKRPGTKYIAEVKESSLATRIIPFEYSTDQSYILELGNQYMRFFTDGAAIGGYAGTEDLSALDNLVEHWKLNDNDATTHTAGEENAHNGIATTNTENLHDTGKVGTGCFDFNGVYAVEIADADALSFYETGNNPFSIAAWISVVDTGVEQVIISKWKDGSTREYKLSLNATRQLKVEFSDDSIDLTADRIAHWKLNENAASTTVDDNVSSIPHDGTAEANTSVLHATGKVGTGSFDMDGQYAVVIDNDHDELSFIEGTDGDFSICAWVNVTNNGLEEEILTKWDDDAPDKEWRFRLSFDNKPQIVLYDETNNIKINLEADDALSVGWHFVCATYNGEHSSWTGATAMNYATLYVDGKSVDATKTNNAAYAKMVNGGTKVVIGAKYGVGPALTNFFQDKIDNVALFKRTLTAAEIFSLYNYGVGTEDLGGSYPTVVTDDALSVGWHFVVMTYNSEGGSSATDGVVLYVDGSAVDTTTADVSTYVGMESTTAKLRIGANANSAGGLDHIWADKIDNVAIFKDVLTASEVAALTNGIPYEITTPYLTADLFELKYEQSADVLYITHPDYETRKLSRYANNSWSLDVFNAQNGPFRDQNTDATQTIAASATTGTVILTATNCSPFVAGTISGHLPSGSEPTSKSQTGALFKLVHPLSELEYHTDLEDNYTNSQVENTSWMDCGTLYKGATWTLITNGTWNGTLEVQRNYTIGAAHDADGWEAIFEFSSSDDRNVSTTGTEDLGDASYRCILTATGDAAEDCEVYFSTDQTEHIGIVEITSVASTTSATGRVLTTLASTGPTYKWSESAWSNYRGWPRTVTFFDDRLVFGGNISQPDTIWGSVTSDYNNMKSGTNDDDAIIFTLSSRQVNVIEWIIGKDKLIIGTSGAEWTIDGGTDEPLTPSNIIAQQQSTYGSADVQAVLANESVLFFQRGAEKMRELAYNWEIDSYVAPDMTILSNFVADGGIVDVAFQKTPDSVLWCVRSDGEMPVFSYERKENIAAWSRIVTADSTSDSDIESVARIHGDPEDEVWAVIKRTINGSTVRYIEQFQPRDFGSDAADRRILCRLWYYLRLYPLFCYDRTRPS